MCKNTGYLFAGARHLFKGQHRHFCRSHWLGTSTADVKDTSGQNGQRYVALTCLSSYNTQFGTCITHYIIDKRDSIRIEVQLSDIVWTAFERSCVWLFSIYVDVRITGGKLTYSLPALFFLMWRSAHTHQFHF